MKIAGTPVVRILTQVNKMHEKQIENLVNQSPEERYEYFVRYCADFEMVWGLGVDKNSWVIFKDIDGEEIFPLWPHHDLAKTCCFDEHRSIEATPKQITLESFLQKCIPDMISSDVQFGIFYDRAREGVVVDGATLKKALEDEVSAVWE